MDDRYGLKLTTASATARDAYVEGIDRMLAADAGVEQSLSEAITADPEFALAHAAMARQHQLYVRPDEARASAETAVRLSQFATAREQQHVEIVRLLIAGQSPKHSS